MRRRHKPKPSLTKPAFLTLTKQLTALIARQQELIKQKSKLEGDIYKYETEFLEFGQGFPITNSLDFYLGQKVERKKYVVQAKDRIFSVLLPKVYR